jgi:16S rRNA (adenine1518-N6/adenine1519-N6)-dimethyltransferase
VTVVPKKALGQHFLVDENILGVIGRLAELDPSDVVLEVGPGLGVLTRYLAERVEWVHAAEIDRSLEPGLRGIQRTTIHWGDALALEPETLDPPPEKLVSNLPYNVATPLVVESLDRYPAVALWCVMVQREVADRFFAVPRTKAYGAVSVLVQLVSERSGFHPVSREVFRPRPNVDSALVAFRRIAPGIDPEVKRLVEGSFAHRRKTLANSLALSGRASRERAVAALEALGRLSGARAEELSPPEFVALAAELQ